MKARELLHDAAHTPEALKIIGKAFDEAWAEIAPRFDDDAGERARLQLAHAVLAVAQEHGQSTASLKNAALQVIALTYRDRP